MARRRISSKIASEIASDRMSKLFELSKDAAKNGDDKRAIRYVSIARCIGQKTRTPIPDDVRFCKGCGMPLSIEADCRVRIGDGRVKITCLKCGTIKRMPYTREQRE